MTTLREAARQRNSYEVVSTMNQILHERGGCCVLTSGIRAWDLEGEDGVADRKWVMKHVHVRDKELIIRVQS